MPYTHNRLHTSIFSHSSLPFDLGLVWVEGEKASNRDAA